MMEDWACCLLIFLAWNMVVVDAAEYQGIPAKWRCYPETCPFTETTVWQYRGQESMTRATKACGGWPLMSVYDLDSKCLSQYVSRIDSTGTYAVDRNGEVSCFKQVNAGQCAVLCNASESILVHVLCNVTVTLYTGPKAKDFPNCPLLPDLQFGRISYPNGRRYYAYAQFQCNIGYKLNSTVGVFCDHPGIWISYTGLEIPNHLTLDVAKACEVDPNSDYTPPHNVSNGNWIFSPSGKTVTLSCNPGYSLVNGSGNSSVVNGWWTESYSICEALCPTVEALHQGFIYISNISTSSQAFAMCFDDFTFVGDPVSICQEDGSWSAVNGSCVVACPAFQSISNGFLHITSNAAHSSAFASCEYGYIFHGDASVTCLENGAWSLPDGECKALCLDLPSSAFNGRVNISQMFEGGEATLTCPKGYRLAGPGTSVCNSDGIWSSLGSCEGGMITPGPATSVVLTPGLAAGITSGSTTLRPAAATPRPPAAATGSAGAIAAASFGGLVVGVVVGMALVYIIHIKKQTYNVSGNGLPLSPVTSSKEGIE